MLNAFAMREGKLRQKPIVGQLIEDHIRR